MSKKKQMRVDPVLSLPPVTPSTFGDWLRVRRGLESLRAIAQRGGCSHSWLSQVETGYVKPGSIRLDSVGKLALAYAVTVKDLLKHASVLDAPVRWS